MMGAEAPPAALSRVGFLVETEGSEHVAFSYVDRQTTAELLNIEDDSIPVKCFRKKGTGPFWGQTKDLRKGPVPFSRGRGNEHLLTPAPAPWDNHAVQLRVSYSYRLTFTESVQPQKRRSNRFPAVTERP